MREKILKLIEEQCEERDLIPLYVVLEGSRGWGFPSPKSDYDVKFVYINKNYESYLQLSEQDNMKRQIEFSSTQEEEINCVGWDIKKFLFQLTKGNPSCFEWLGLDEMYTIYADDIFGDIINDRVYFFQPKPILNSLRGRFHDYKKDLISNNNINLKELLHIFRLYEILKQINVSILAYEVNFLKAIFKEGVDGYLIGLIQRRGVGCSITPIIEEQQIEYIQSVLLNVEKELEQAEKVISKLGDGCKTTVKTDCQKYYYKFLKKYLDLNL